MICRKIVRLVDTPDGAQSKALLRMGWVRAPFWGKRTQETAEELLKAHEEAGLPKLRVVQQGRFSALLSRRVQKLRMALA
jgi:hypothetical protein